MGGGKGGGARERRGALDRDQRIGGRDAVLSPVPARHGGLVEQIVIGRWDN